VQTPEDVESQPSKTQLGNTTLLLLSSCSSQRMAQYTYDDSGVMAAAFAMTFLIFILVPTTYSLIPVSELRASIHSLKSLTPHIYFPLSPVSRKQTPSCPCPECAEKTAREKKEERVVKFSPKCVLSMVQSTELIDMALPDPSLLPSAG
jgi:hypothetical protein